MTRSSTVRASSRRVAILRPAGSGRADSRPVPSRPDPWILGPGSDLAWFLLAPAWILALAWVARDWPGLGLFGGALLALGATGHHLPGFIRAYSDPALFRRFRVRFLAAPAFFLAISLAFAALGLHGLELALVLWGAWHGAMQVNGFARIYDGKAGSFSPTTARLDRAVCLAGFAGGLLYSEPRLQLVGMTLQRAGIPLPSPASLAAARAGWIALAALVALAFAANAAAGYRQGKGPGALKLLSLAMGIGFWWFCMARIRAPLLGVLLFELFHDVQYNVLVWAYQRNRVDAGSSVSFLERFLFRPAPLRAAAYLACLLAYGALGAAAGFGDPGRSGGPGGASAAGLILSHLFIASAFLHFYYDGFIWRVREAETRRGLGMEARAPAGAGPARSAHAPRSWRATAAQAAGFLAPVLALGCAELTHAPLPPLEANRELAPLLPRMWEAQVALGSLELEAGNARAAAGAFRSACALKPDLDLGGPLYLARLFAQGGDAAAAIGEYRKALGADPGDLHARYDLGLLLRGQGRLAEAVPELKAVADRTPGDAGTNYSAGYALLLARQVTEAIPYLERCVSADSSHKRGWNYLGVAREALGMRPAAILCYRRALSVDPEFAEALRNLRAAEGLERGAGAESGYRKALPSKGPGSGNS